MFQLYGWWLSWLLFLQKVRTALILITLVLSVQNSFANNDQNIVVTEEHGVFHISASAKIPVSKSYLRQVITDYVHAYRINSAIIESEILTSPTNGNIRVRAKVLCCTALFCREAERVDEVKNLANGAIKADIVPEKSDFASGTALWQFIPDGDGTQLVYQASIEPRFFIPPVIGTRMVIESLQKQFSATFSRIAIVAKIQEELEWKNEMGVTYTANELQTAP